MNARWRARVRASYRADGCSSASMQSRIMVKTVTAPALRLVRRTDAPERPLIVAPPCQSEIKRTLRRARRQSKTVCSRGVHMPRTGLFGGDGERRVSGTSPAWFRKGGRGRHPVFDGKSPSIENLHRIQSVGFFTNFRRFNLNANTRDLSTAVSQGPIARSSATKTKDTARV